MIRILGSLFIIPLAIYANSSMHVSVDRLHVTYGDSVQLRIEIEGSDFEQPNLTTICGVPVSGHSSSTSLIGNNGVFTKSYRLEFSFVPQQSCEIAPIALLIDGKTQRSAPIAITVGEPKATRANGDYVLTLQSSKHSLYLGEPFRVTLSFKKRIGAPMDDYKFYKPEFKNFWLKSQSKPKQFRQGSYEVTQIDFIVAPKKTGALRSDRAKIAIGMRSNQRRGWGDFFAKLDWKNYFSNALDVNVSKLPAGIDIVGDLQMAADTDTRTIEANSAVNLTLSIKGRGNVEDIEPFTFQIPDASVFKEEPTMSTRLINGKIVSSWQQKVTIVAQHDFTIPALRLRYFNTTTQRIETLSSDAIRIAVKGAPRQQAHQDVVVKRAALEGNQSTQSLQEPGTSTSAATISSWWAVLLIALAAFSAGVVSVLLVQRLRTFKQSSRKQTRNASLASETTLHALLKQLLPYMAHSDEVAQAVDALERHLYRGEVLTLSKRELKALIKQQHTK